MLKAIAAVAVLIACAVVGLGGCSFHTEPAYGYAEVTAAPVDVDVYSYPHTYYLGRPVYWYRDRWYYRDGGRWYYYRDEPPPLYEYRRRGYVQQAPPAPRYYAPPPNAPPPAAPPAVRVR
jgi:hypothetical protein